MKVISQKIIKQVKELRKRGFSHREIAKELKTSVGSAYKYSKEIKLTKEQHLRLKRRNLKYIYNLSPENRKRAQRKGGRIAPNKFVTKYTKKELIGKLKKFAKNHKRIPTKRDFVAEYRAFLRIFGSWNNAIEDASLKPNRSRFTKKI